MGDNGKSDELKIAPGAQDQEPEEASGESLRRRRRKPRDKNVERERTSELQARQRAIGLELRRVFDEIVEEPIPPEFLKLLDDIDRKGNQ